MSKIHIEEGHLGLFKIRIYGKNGKIFFKLKADETTASAKIKLYCGEYDEADDCRLKWETVPELIMKLDTAIIPRTLYELTKLSDDSDLPDHAQIQDKGTFFRSTNHLFSELSVHHGRLRYKLIFNNELGRGKCNFDLGYAIPSKVEKVMEITSILTEAIPEMSSSRYHKTVIDDIPYLDY